MFGLLGTAVNTVAVLVGGAIGLLCKKVIPHRMADNIFKVLGLCTLFIGVTGIFQDGVNTLAVIVSMVLGAVIGELLRLDERVNALGKHLEDRVSRDRGEQVSIAEGFVSASLLFCTGAMTIVGSLQSGLLDDHTTLYIKSILDFTAALIFASSLGVGVLLSAGFVFVYQGLIAVISRLLGGVFSGGELLIASGTELTPFMLTVNTMSAVGYLIIIALAMNMIGVTKWKVMNMVPAIFLPIALVPLFGLIPI